MDTVGAHVYGQIPAFENLPPVNDDGGSAMHVYTPLVAVQGAAGGQAAVRPRLPHRAERRPEDARGRDVAEILRFTKGTYGKKLKQEARRY